VYSEHFQLADDYIGHVDDVIGAIGDDFIKSRYVGFLAVSAVTAYELAFKEIIFDFADRKHKILGSFARESFERLNGRIMVREIKETHVKKFGVRYVNKFKRQLDIKELDILKREGKSIQSSYANVIRWRNAFAHLGAIPQGPTFAEAKGAYECGKHVLHCLASSMVR